MKDVLDIPFSMPPANTPFDLRPGVTLDVSGDAFLSVVVDEAAGLLGITVGPKARRSAGRVSRVSNFVDRIGFYAADDPREGCGNLRTTVAIVSAAGIVVIGVPWQSARIGEVVRAADEGYQHGDPSRIYLYPQPSQAGGPTGTWNDFLSWVEVAQTVLQTLGADAAAVASVAVPLVGFRHWIRHRKTQEKGSPAETLTVLLGQSWTLPAARRLLNATSDEEAEATLLIAGFALHPSSGLYVPPTLSNEVQANLVLSYQSFLMMRDANSVEPWIRELLTLRSRAAGSTL